MPERTSAAASSSSTCLACSMLPIRRRRSLDMSAEPERVVVSKLVLVQAAPLDPTAKASQPSTRRIYALQTEAGDRPRRE